MKQLHFGESWVRDALEEGGSKLVKVPRSENASDVLPHFVGASEMHRADRALGVYRDRRPDPAKGSVCVRGGPRSGRKHAQYRSRMCRGHSKALAAFCLSALSHKRASRCCASDWHGC